MAFVTVRGMDGDEVQCEVLESRWVDSEGPCKGYAIVMRPDNGEPMMVAKSFIRPGRHIVSAWDPNVKRHERAWAKVVQLQGGSK
jgi:hypothetical protein